MQQQEFYLLIAGSRGFNDYEEMTYVTDYMLSAVVGKFNIHIISGGARGADALAKRYALEKNYEYHEFPADWQKYGKSAGYIRNTDMHKFIASHPYRAVLCFWDGESKGTAQNFELAKKYRNQLNVYNYKTKAFVR